MEDSHPFFLSGGLETGKQEALIQTADSDQYSPLNVYGGGNNESRFEAGDQVGFEGPTVLVAFSV